MVNIAYKYRLKPNKSHQKLLSQMAGSTRWLWNHMLDLNKKQYAIDKKFLFAYDMHAMLPALKSANTWLKDIPSQSLQQKCTDLDRALKSVWKSGFGFPQFKSKHKSRDSFRIPQTNGHIKISDSHIHIPKIGSIKWHYHQPITGTVKSVTITRDINHWYISVLCEIADVVPYR
jgi:putative transposase